VYEDGHIAEYEDPGWVRRAPDGSRLQSDFLEGRVDYAILGNDLPGDPRARTAIPDAAAAGAQWSNRRGFAPINHVVGFSLAAAREHAEAICAMYDALSGALRSNNGAADVIMEPAGFAALRAPLSQAAEFALQQEILPRRVEIDEVVSGACDALAVPASRLGG
jgi:4,5-dihydroxyphthalate decarboxylase